MIRARLRRRLTVPHPSARTNTPSSRCEQACRRRAKMNKRKTVASRSGPGVNFYLMQREETYASGCTSSAHDDENNDCDEQHGSASAASHNAQHRAATAAAAALGASCTRAGARSVRGRSRRRSFRLVAGARRHCSTQQSIWLVSEPPPPCPGCLPPSS